MKKMTFTLDDDAVRELERAAERLDLPKSHIVREAIQLFGEELGRLTEEERAAKLQLFDGLRGDLPDRPPSEIDDELERLRASRRGGGRRSTSE